MASVSKRDAFNSQSLGAPLNTMVKEARALMVGAGGIGCELLKNLVLSGFGEVHIVDLDTIDLSNLNRQFLFRHEHIKKSKALVAKEAAHRFNPKVKIEAHHANIKDSEFDIGWFKGFTIVFNALDNLEARRHVNKMCLSADVPLIESGTTGFNGQVQVIKKGITACYDCTPKEAPKTFPVCTIRATPSQPIHCIVWGKSWLLNEVFGASEDDPPEMDYSEDNENAIQIQKMRKESEELKKIKKAMGTESFSQLLFDKVFKDDVIKLRNMEGMEWKKTRPPEPLDYATLIKTESPGLEKVLKQGQKTWTLAENVLVFRDSLERLSKRMLEMQASANVASAEPQITFDKDDDDTLDFVAASANIRSIIFGIETRSRFDIKQMAGNIIPAIATTNAIVAGLCVLQSFKVLRGDFSSTKEIFLSPFAPERLLASDRIRGPDPDCPVCSVAQTRVLVDITRATLKDLVDFLGQELEYSEEIVVQNDFNQLLYDMEETDGLPRKLSELGVKANSVLTVIDEDDSQEAPRVNLLLHIQESTEVDGKPIKSLDVVASLNGDSPALLVPRKKKSTPHTNGAGAIDTSKANDSLLVANGTASKRSATEAFETDNHPTKKAKVGGKADDRIIVLDDEDGAILIDD